MIGTMPWVGLPCTPMTTKRRSATRRLVPTGLPPWGKVRWYALLLNDRDVPGVVHVGSGDMRP